MSCCSEKLSRLPVATKWAPSMEPVVAKAQHEPQAPWSLTGVTAPASTQLTSPLIADSSNCLGAFLGMSAFQEYPRRALYSACVQSENWLWPTLELAPLALNSLMNLSAAAKFALRILNSLVSEYSLLNLAQCLTKAVSMSAAVATARMVAKAKERIS